MVTVHCGFNGHMFEIFWLAIFDATANKSCYERGHNTGVEHHQGNKDWRIGGDRINPLFAHILPEWFHVESDSFLLCCTSRRSCTSITLHTGSLH